MTDTEPSYIDYEAFLDPDFSASSFANTLVRATNDASDTQIDLSTPLSRVLFDVQEIDTHIHNLTTKSALPLLAHTQSQSDAAQRILHEVQAQVASLTEGYKQLEEEVIRRHETAEEVRLVASRLWVTVKIGRAVSRCLLLGRQLEAQMADFRPAAAAAAGAAGTGARKEDYKAMVRACNSFLALRAIFSASGPGEEGEHLARINVLSTLRTDLMAPSENRLRSRAQQIIREFSLSSLASSSSSSSGVPGATSTQTTTTTSPQTYAQTEETKSRFTSACLTLYLLSPPPTSSKAEDFQPTLLLAALQAYLQSALTSSLSTLARSLAQLSTLPRTLTEVTARCQNICSLESLLASIAPPPHPLLLTSSSLASATQSTTTTTTTNTSLLAPLLQSLDTNSLPSYFWRTLASGLGGRVAEILSKGGVGARNLRASRERLRESFREAVLRGCEAARREEGRAGGSVAGAWEREVNVMVGSVVGQLGR